MARAAAHLLAMSTGTSLGSPIAPREELGHTRRAAPTAPRTACGSLPPVSAPDPDALLARVRQICFDFAGVEEKLSHGAPFFHVKGRGIASFASGHHQSGHVALWCKSTRDAQERLVKRDPDVYFVPPYVGVGGWVGVRLDLPATDFEALAILVEEAWRSVAPKRLLDAAPSPPPKAPVYPTTDPAVVREALSKLTAIAEALPDTSVEEGAGRVTFRVGKRPFAYLVDNEHRSGVVAVYFKATREEAEALAADAPKRYFVPPYMGAHGWAAMRVDVGKVPWKELARRVAASHAGPSRR